MPASVTDKLAKIDAKRQQLDTEEKALKSDLGEFLADEVFSNRLQNVKATQWKKLFKKISTDGIEKLI